MRVVETRKKGVFIESPWMRPEEAADYVGLSRSEFSIRAKDVPHGGGRRIKLYHEKVLDKWLNGELAVPFDQEEPAKEQRSRFVRIREDQTEGYINPRTGKFRPSISAAK